MGRRIREKSYLPREIERLRESRIGRDTPFEVRTAPRVDMGLDRSSFDVPSRGVFSERPFVSSRTSFDELPVQASGRRNPVVQFLVDAFLRPFVPLFMSGFAPMGGEAGGGEATASPKEKDFLARLAVLKEAYPPAFRLGAGQERGLIRDVAKAIGESYHMADLEIPLLWAVEILKKKFTEKKGKGVPSVQEKTAAGGMPSDALILASLVTGFRTARQERSLDHSQKRTVDILFGPFAIFISEYRHPLDLAGTNAVEPAKKGRRPGSAGAEALPSATDAAASVQAAVKRYAVLSTAIDDAIEEVSGEGRLKDVALELSSLRSDLAGFGHDKISMTANLTATARRREALNRLARFDELLDEAENILTVVAAKFDERRLKKYHARLLGDVALWLGEKGGAYTADKELLYDFLHDYIGFWLMEQKGSSPPRLTYVQKAKEAAVYRSGERIKDALLRERFAMAAGHLLASLVRMEFNRARHDTGSAKRIASGDLPDLGVQEAENFGNPVKSPDDFRRVLGEELYSALNDLIKELRPAGKSVAAAAFRELLIHYVRLGVGTYGSSFDADFMKKNGLIAELVRAVFTRVEDPQIFTDEVLDILRKFFLDRVHADPKDVPETGELKPFSGTLAGEGAESAVVDLAKDDAISGLVASLPFPMTGSEIKAFEKEVDISYKRFLRWRQIGRRPPKMSRHIREGLKKAYSGDERTAFLAAHAAPGGEVSEKEWNDYVAYCFANGRPEYVTVEPADSDGLDAVLKAYNFFEKRARKMGQHIDPLSFLAAISKVVGRMINSSVDGAIFLEVPGLLSNIPFEHMHYPVLARRVKLVAKDKGQSILELESFLHAHAEGRVESPEYWTLEGYASFIAGMTGEGTDRAKKDRIYTLLAGLFKYAYFIESTVDVFDFSGKKVSFSPDDGPKGYRIYLYPAADVYITAKGEMTPQSAGVILRDARRGKYSRMLRMVRTFLEGVSRMKGIMGESAEISLTFSDGEKAALPKMLGLLSALEERDAFYFAAGKDMRNNGLSPDDLKNVAAFYGGLREFAEEVLVFTRVRGSFRTLEGFIPFELVPRLLKHNFQPTREGRVPVFLDDAVSVANEESWSDERLRNLLLIRAIIGRIAAEGAKGGAMEEIERYWPEGRASLAQAAEDFVRLEGGKKGNELRDTIADIISVASPGTEEGKPRPRPFISHRRRVKDWSEQFRKMLTGLGFTVEVADLAASAIADYFSNVRMFYHRFWPEALKESIDARLKDIDPKVRENIMSAAADFLPRVGVAGGKEEPDGKAVEAARVDDIAIEALDAYSELFPETPVLPLVEDLLLETVSRFCLEARDENIAVTVVLKRTRELIQEHNLASEPAKKGISPPEAPLLSGGMMSGNLSSKTRNAYRNLLPLILEGRDITIDIIKENSPKLSEEECAALKKVIELSKMEIEEWKLIIGDQVDGIVPFVRERFKARFVNDEELAKMALEYVAGRLVSLDDVDAIEIAYETIGDRFGVYKDVTEKMASYYLTLLGRYLRHLGDAYEKRISSALIILEVTAEDKTCNPATPGELLGKAEADLLSEAGVSSLNDLFRLGRREKLVMEMLGELGKKDFEERLQSVFEAKFKGWTGEEEREIRNLRSEFAKRQEILESFVTRALSVYSAYSGIAPPDTAAFGETEARELIKVMEQGLVLFLGLIRESSTLEKYPTEMAELAEKVNSAKLAGLREPPLAEKARELNDRFGDTMAKIKDLNAAMGERSAKVKDRLKELERSEFERRARSAMAGILPDLESKTSELEKEARIVVSDAEKLLEVPRGLYNEITEKLAGLSGTAPVSFNFFKATLETFESFWNAVPEKVASLRSMKTVLEKRELEADPLVSRAREILNRGVEGGKRGDLEVAIELLGEAINNLGAARATIDGYIKELEGHVEGLKEYLAGLAKRLEVPSDVGLAPPEESASEPRDMTPFTENGPDKSYDEQAREVLVPVFDGGVLVAGEKGYIVRKVEGQKQDADIFGRKFERMPGQPVIDIVPFERLAAGHPARRLIDSLKLAVKENGYEARIVSLVYNRGGEMFRSLAGFITYLRKGTDPAGAREAVRAWAERNTKALLAAFGKEAPAWFEPVKKGFNERLLMSFVAQTGLALTYPTCGRIVVVGSDGKEKIYLADNERAVKTVEEEEFVFRVYDDKKGWVELDLRGRPGTVVNRYSPISNTRGNTLSNKLWFAITNDALLKDLIYYLTQDELDPEFRWIMRALVENYALAPEEERISLLELQDAARGIYERYKAAKSSAVYPELARVRPDAMKKWLAAIELPSEGEIKRFYDMGGIKNSGRSYESFPSGRELLDVILPFLESSNDIRESIAMDFLIYQASDSATRKRAAFTVLGVAFGLHIDGLTVGSAGKNHLTEHSIKPRARSSYEAIRRAIFGDRGKFEGVFQMSGLYEDVMKDVGERYPYLAKPASSPGWEGTDPAEKVDLIFPEMKLLDERFVAVMKDALLQNTMMGSSDDTITNGTLGVLGFMDDNPDLKNAALVLFVAGMMAPKGAVSFWRFFGEYSAARGKEGFDKAAMKDRFVRVLMNPRNVTVFRNLLMAKMVVGRKGLQLDFVTDGSIFDPANLNVLVDILVKEFGARSGQRVAQIIMGEKEPWLQFSPASDAMPKPVYRLGEYNIEVHHRILSLFDNWMEVPVLGMLSACSNEGVQLMFHVDAAEMTKKLEGMRDRSRPVDIRVYDKELGSWKTVRLSPGRFDIHLPPVDSRSKMFGARLMQKIYSDRRYMNLGFIINWAKKNGEALPEFMRAIEEMLSDITELAPGQKDVLTLDDVQNYAVWLYQKHMDDPQDETIYLGLIAKRIREKPGLVRAHFDDGGGWRGVSAADRLKMILPEAFNVKREVVAKQKEFFRTNLLDGSVEGANLKRTRNVLKFMEDFQEFSGAAVLLMYAYFVDKYSDSGMKFFDSYSGASGDAKEKETIAGRFVDLLLERDTFLRIKAFLKGQIVGKTGAGSGVLDRVTDVVLSMPGEETVSPIKKGLLGKSLKLLGAKVGQTVAEILMMDARAAPEGENKLGLLSQFDAKDARQQSCDWLAERIRGLALNFLPERELSASVSELRARAREEGEKKAGELVAMDFTPDAVYQMVALFQRIDPSWNLSPAFISHLVDRGLLRTHTETISEAQGLREGEMELRETYQFIAENKLKIGMMLK